VDFAGADHDDALADIYTLRHADAVAKGLADLNIALVGNGFSTFFVDHKHRKATNVAAVALANKNARVISALLAHDEVYRQPA